MNSTVVQFHSSNVWFEISKEKNSKSQRFAGNTPNQADQDVCHLSSSVEIRQRHLLLAGRRFGNWDRFSSGPSGEIAMFGAVVSSMFLLTMWSHLWNHSWQTFPHNFEDAWIFRPQFLRGYEYRNICVYSIYTDNYIYTCTVIIYVYILDYNIWKPPKLDKMRFRMNQASLNHRSPWLGSSKDTSKQDLRR